MFIFVHIGASDFVQLSTTLTFMPSSATEPQCQSVTINSDDILEVDESFLMVLSSTDRAVNSLPVQATVNIEDSTGMTMAKQSFIAIVDTSQQITLLHWVYFAYHLIDELGDNLLYPCVSNT